MVSVSKYLFLMTRTGCMMHVWWEGSRGGVEVWNKGDVLLRTEVFQIMIAIYLFFVLDHALFDELSTSIHEVTGIDFKRATYAG